MSWKPPCFDSARQYRAYAAAAVESGDAKQRARSRYCLDCTPEYQQEMKAQGRCLHPDTTFGPDSDGLICGTRPTKCGS